MRKFRHPAGSNAVQLTVPQSVRAQLEFNTALAAARVYGPQAALETAFATAAAAFETAHGHAPRSLDEVEAVVAGLSEFQADRTLTATLSRRMWRELRRLVELNEARVDEQLRAMPDQALGALYL